MISPYIRDEYFVKVLIDLLSVDESVTLETDRDVLLTFRSKTTWTGTIRLHPLIKVRTRSTGSCKTDGR